MDSIQLHLMFNHLSLFTLPLCLILFVITNFYHAHDVRKWCLGLIVLVGIFNVFIFISGDVASEALEGFPGFSAQKIELHETWARFAVISTGIVSLYALLILILPRFLRNGFWILPLLGIGSTVLLGITAHYGGQIRHTELHPEISSPGPATEPSSESDSVPEIENNY